MGNVQVHEVYATSLENTVTGENPKRRVAIYLPPDYFNGGQEYPVIYLLHGIQDTERVWTQAWYDPDDPWGTIARLMDQGIAQGRIKPMIVVMPDQRTKAAGSFYVNSSVTGHWETFTVKELVNWVDRHYRTLSDPASRGLAGHSMGGYGAITLGMKHPDRFSVVYALNPAMLGWGGDFSDRNPAFRTVTSRRDGSEFQGFYEPAIVCLAQAFSPNPDRPPFYADFPFVVSDHRLSPNPVAFPKWQARLGINMLERYQENMKRLAGLRFDSGYDDEFTHIPITSRAFSRRLTELGIDHIFEEYNGDHRNRLWGRQGRLYNEVLPWFSLLLKHSETKRD